MRKVLAAFINSSYDTVRNCLDPLAARTMIPVKTLDRGECRQGPQNFLPLASNKVPLLIGPRRPGIGYAVCLILPGDSFSAGICLWYSRKCMQMMA